MNVRSPRNRPPGRLQEPGFPPTAAVPLAGHGRGDRQRGAPLLHRRADRQGRIRDGVRVQRRLGKRAGRQGPAAADNPTGRCAVSGRQLRKLLVRATRTSRSSTTRSNTRTLLSHHRTLQLPARQPIARRGLDADRWIPYVASDILRRSTTSAAGYVHKDLHPGNVFVTETRPSAGCLGAGVVVQGGDLGLTRLESDIRVFRRCCRMDAPARSLQSGRVRRNGARGHLSDWIAVAGIDAEGSSLLHPRGNSRRHPPGIGGQARFPFGPVIAKALRRHVEWRTQTALEFWHELSE